MFDRLVAFARGKLHVRDFHIVLIIEPHLGAQLIAGPLRHDPDGFQRRFLTPFSLRGSDGVRTCSTRARKGCIHQSLCRFQRAIGSPCGIDHRQAVMADRRAGGIGTEHGVSLVPRQLAATMAPQMHHGRPAARHGDRIAGDVFQTRPFASLHAQGHTGDTLGALNLGDALAGFHPDPQGPRLCGQRPIGDSARIHDAGHRQPRLFQRNRRAVGVIIVGHNHSAIPGRHGPVHHIIAHSRGEHHPGHIIARKGQRAFQSPRCRNDPLSPNAPQAFLWATIAGGVIGHAVLGQNIAVVINPCHHAAGTQADIGHGFKGLQGFLHPKIRRHPVDHIAVHRRTTAPERCLFQHHNPRTTCGGCEGGLQTRNPTARNQNVAERIGLLIAVAVHFLGRRAKACGFADDRLEHVLPSRPRMDEGFVVKPTRQEPRQGVVHNANVHL